MPRLRADSCTQMSWMLMSGCNRTMSGVDLMPNACKCIHLSLKRTECTEEDSIPDGAFVAVNGQQSGRRAYVSQATDRFL